LKNNRDRKGEWKNEIYIRKDVDKRSCKSEKSKEDRLLVDSGAIYTVVPAEDLQEQGIAAHSAREFELADGAVIKRKVGNAYFEDEIRAILPSIQDEIQSRLQEFDSVLKTGDEESIFAELVFCILTPQSKAKSAWAAVERLLDKDLLLTGTEDQILMELHGVRFKYKKAGYIIKARNMFLVDGKIAIESRISRFSGACDAREWLVRNVKGIGYKEASHFLRNIGHGADLAILDRHILKNLRSLQVIEEVPASLSRRRYLEIEKGMKELAEETKIPMSHLDLVLWYKETGEVFK
jgi:N-glycosylase/DNA lyase